MKNTILLACVLCASSGFAYANGENGHPSVNMQQQQKSLSQSKSASLSGAMNIEHNVSNVEAPDLDKTVPNVFAPALTAGSNNCALSISGGVSFAGAGASLAAAYESGECNVRESLRVMGGMLRTENNPQAASILKSISCQSVIYWDSLELAAIEMGNADLACKNERPEELGRFELRRPNQLPESYPAMVANDSVKLETHNATAQQSNCNQFLIDNGFCY